MTEHAAPQTTILYVDDSRMMRFAARKALGERYRVLLAVDGLDAVRVLEENEDIAAVITDLRMSGCNGLELVEMLRNESTPLGARRLPVLVVSGLADAGDIERLRAAGADDFMTKPFTDCGLQLRVERLLSGRPDTGERVPVFEVPLAANIVRTRAGFTARYQQAVAMHQRHDLPLALLRFHVRNGVGLDAALGAGGRDAALRMLERIIAASVRTEDTVARTGPDHMTLLLPATTAAGARSLRKRLRNLFELKTLTVRGKAVTLELEFFVHLPKTGTGPVPPRVDDRPEAVPAAAEVGA